MKYNKTKKINIVKKISNKTGLSLNYSKKITDDLIDIIVKKIKLGYLNLKNIGSFTIKFKKERIGRNPKTKEEYIISARKSLLFASSKNISKEN